MFFTECARLSERHPNLAAAFQKIDAQLHEMGTAEVIRVDDFASFLGIDPNQAAAVFEKLAQEKLLLAEEMVECGDCGMPVLRTDFEEVLEEEDEYRCTSCDRPFTDKLIRSITTYRSGEKWRKISIPIDRSGDPCLRETSSRSVPSNVTLDEEAFYTHFRLAEIFGVPKDALRKRLDRYREHNLNGWKENEDRRPREPRHLYRLKDIRGIIDELRASSQRPAK